MQKNSLSNHEITKNNTKRLFLTYDQKKMIKKWELKHDENYLYINFVGNPYRINRHTGDVDLTDREGNFITEAGFSETLTIFDLLCYSKDDCFPAGKYCSVYSLKGIAFTAGPGKGMFDKYGQIINNNRQILTILADEIGAEETDGADISYKFNVFDFMPAIMRFWESDDEFPAELKFYWDENILMYMHFETVFYVMSHIYGLIDRISMELQR